MFFQFIKKYQISSAIILFILIVSILQTIQPAFMCNQDGTYKTFGIGYRNKTVVPMWLIIILVAILSYTGILYISTMQLR